MELKLNNKLVPKHEIMDEKDVEKMLGLYNITCNELPRIKKDDPALKEHDPAGGDVIKITRKSQSAGTSFYYRIVIDG